MSDSDVLIGTGFQFPIKVNKKGGLPWSSGPGRIQDAIWIILSTALGERVMRPTFGAGADSFVFEPNSPASRVRMADVIKDGLSQWEPRIELDDVTVSAVPDADSSVLVTIQYRIGSTYELFNMVYPLYVQEGLG
jgi:phage baseplate assembly protein W